MNAGDRIKELRTLNNLTQEELGEKVGVKKAAVQKWESGITKNLKRSTIQKLSEIFDVSPTYVMGMSNVKNPSTSKRIPLLGQIAAGIPIMAEENIEDYFNIDSKIKADFALKVKGDSMLCSIVKINCKPLFAFLRRFVMLVYQLYCYVPKIACTRRINGCIVSRIYI